MVFPLFLQAPCGKARGTVEVRGAARRALQRSVRCSGFSGATEDLDSDVLFLESERSRRVDLRRAALSQMKYVLISFVLFWQASEGQEAIKGTLHLGDAAAIEDGHRGRTVTRGTVKAEQRGKNPRAAETTHGQTSA